MKRTLSLTRETLTELTATQLHAVQGGAAQITSPLTDCLDSHAPRSVHLDDCLVATASGCQTNNC